MTWLVFGVSCLLVLAGAVSIISGAPIIQLERGWAEVISGTVALSSGGVVFALAGILMRLEAIRDAMAAQSLPVPAETVPASAVAEAPAVATVPAPVPPPPAAEPTLIAPPEPISVATPDLRDEGASQGLWKRVKRPASETPDPEGLRQHGFPDRVLPDADEPTRDSNPSVVVPAHIPAAVPAPTVPPPVAPMPRDGTPDTDDGAQIGWLERSLFQGRPPRTSGEPARAEPALHGDAEPAASQPTMLRPAPVLPAPSEAAEPEPTPDLASEQHGGATVVGRYQAGSASYVMYSDGTIEVETESGEMHRFGSMDDLKAFIAKQDASVS